MHVDILDAVALGMFEISSCRSVQILMKLEMWANAQRDGHPAEYRWHPLFNADDAHCWSTMQ